MKSADGCVISTTKLVRADRTRTSTTDVEGRSVCRMSADDFTMRTMDVRVCMMGTKCVQLVRSGTRWWTASAKLLFNLFYFLLFFTTLRASKSSQVDDKVK